MKNEVNLIVFADRAHGKNIPGKGSPDGKHKEYIWSNELIKDLKKELRGHSIFCLKNPSVDTVPTYQSLSGIKEILTPRKEFYANYDAKYKLVLSFHNDGTDGNEWTNATGWSAWTTKGNTISDYLFENYFFNEIKTTFKDFPHRKYLIDGNDNEANYTVLTGSGYAAILFEWGFSNNRNDLERIYNDIPKLAKTLTKCIVNINNDLNNENSELIKRWKV